MAKRFVAPFAEIGLIVEVVLRVVTFVAGYGHYSEMDALGNESSVIDVGVVAGYVKVVQERR